MNATNLPNNAPARLRSSPSTCYLAVLPLLMDAAKECGYGRDLIDEEYDRADRKRAFLAGARWQRRMMANDKCSHGAAPLPPAPGSESE